jgi:hypothetical protein
MSIAFPRLLRTPASKGRRSGWACSAALSVRSSTTCAQKSGWRCPVQRSLAHVSAKPPASASLIRAVAARAHAVPIGHWHRRIFRLYWNCTQTILLKPRVAHMRAHTGGDHRRVPVWLNTPLPAAFYRRQSTRDRRLGHPSTVAQGDPWPATANTTQPHYAGIERHRIRLQATAEQLETDDSGAVASVGNPKMKAPVPMAGAEQPKSAPPCTGAAF